MLKYRTLQNESCNGYRVSLNVVKNRHTGETEYRVKYAGTTRSSRKTHTQIFSRMDDAKAYYVTVRANGLDALSDSYESIESRRSDAILIRDSPNTPRHFQKTVALALAILAEGTILGDKNSAYLERLAFILREENTLPAVNDVEGWLSRILEIIKVKEHRTEGAETIAKTTFIKRFNYLKSALEYIVSYPIVFGKPFCERLSLALAQKRKDNRTLISRDTRSIKNFAPLGRTQIETLLAVLGEGERLWVLKSLCSGLRPSEVIRLNISHLANGRLMLKEIVSKTKAKSNPPASLALRILLHLESKPVKPPSERYREKEFSKEHGITPYSFRTTLATHLIYCGVSFTQVQEKLSHASADMLLSHYANSLPPQAINNPADYYSDCSIKLSVGGTQVEVAHDENAYDKWLLRLVLRYWMPSEGTEREEFKQQVLSLADIRDARKSVEDEVY